VQSPIIYYVDLSDEPRIFSLVLSKFDMGGNYELLAVMVGTLNFTPKLTDSKSDMDVESHPLSHHVHADTVTDECLRFSADYSRSGVDLILSKVRSERIVEFLHAGFCSREQSNLSPGRPRGYENRYVVCMGV
jgi:hypothetical protein